MSSTAGVLLKTGKSESIPGLLVGSVLFIFIVFFMFSYYVSLRSEFRIVMSVTISAYNRSSVRCYLQFFVGGLMSY